MKPNRIQQQIAAAERRADKARAHAERMAQHAEHRVAVALWQAAYDLWQAADCIGPEPLHPDVLKERQQERAMLAQRKSLVTADAFA